MRLLQSFTARIANVLQHTKGMKIAHQVPSPVSISKNSNLWKHIFSFESYRIGYLLRPTLIEAGNSRNHRLLPVARKLGINWERKHFAAGCLRIRKIANAIAQIFECRFNVERARIINFSRNSTTAQIFLQRISSRGANRELIV